jgi:hypothetical protein
MLLRGRVDASPAAGHQTGWTGVIAGLIEIFGKLNREKERV